MPFEPHRRARARRILLAAFAVGVVAAFIVIGLAAAGGIRPEPTLGVIGGLAGGVALAALAFGAVQRRRT